VGCGLPGLRRDDDRDPDPDPALGDAPRSLKNDVRELRTERGLSQGELAQALDVSRQSIISIEKGRYVPSLPLAIALARFFGRSVEEVFHPE
jgi:putative transcriptional regulator